MESTSIAIGEVHNISACEIKASGKAVGLKELLGRVIDGLEIN